GHGHRLVLGPAERRDDDPHDPGGVAERGSAGALPRLLVRRIHRARREVMKKSAAVERWFKTTKPPSEAALRRVRDIILGADPSMRERTQYGITFSSTKIPGDFAAFVRY